MKDDVCVLRHLYRPKAFTAALLFSFLAGSRVCAASGAVVSTDNIVYPPDAFATSTITTSPSTVASSGVLNIKTLFGAVGDGITDDTAAFIAAYDAVQRDYKNGSTISNPRQVNDLSDEKIIYIPNGTYLVSDTIVYSFPGFTRDQTTTNEGLQKLRFRGQSQAGTTIKLKDNAPGFGAGQNKPVISYTKLFKSDTVASNFFENITIDVGSGNPGAIGLRFEGANNSAIRNVTIRSSDGAHAGYIGLELPMGSCQGYYSNVSVDGFDYGISASSTHSSSKAFEHITVTRQRIGGVRVVDTGVSLRDLYSINTVPAVLLTSSAAHLALVDSLLTGGDPSTPAINMQSGFLFARNISTSGYSMSLQDSRNSRMISSPNIGEYSSAGTISVFNPQPPLSLNLPVEETPTMPWPQDLGQWASVKSFGASGNGVADDSEAIQAAMNSGKPVVYFTPGTYLVDKTITIPPTVERVNFMFVHILAGSTLSATATMEAAFKVAETSANPLLLEDLYSWTGGEHFWFEQASKRPLILSDLHAQRGRMFRSTVPGSKVYIENVSNRISNTTGNPFMFTGIQVWARHLNAEGTRPQFLSDNSRTWILGFKTEGPSTVFDLENGGETEVLNGCENVSSGSVPENRPMILNNSSSASIIMNTTNTDTSTSNPNNIFRVIVSETQGSSSGQIPWDASLVRYGNHQVVLPLYNSYRATMPLNVTRQLSVSTSGFLVNRAMGTYNATVVITNDAVATKFNKTSIESPIQLVINDLPDGLAMRNAAGSFNGKPYITVPGSLEAGKSVSVAVSVLNPGSKPIRFTPEVYSGPLQ